MLRRALVPLVALSLLAGCQTILGFDDFEPATSAGGSSGSGGGVSACAGLDRPKDQREMVQTVRKTGACFWVDKKEVSRADFQAFLDATVKASPPGPTPPPLISACGDDSTFEIDAACEAKAISAIQANSPGILDGAPRTCVNWCDASSYCSWSGKQLCKGAFDATDPAESAWLAACTDDGTNTYGNGSSTYKPNTCRDGGESPVDCVIPGNCLMARVEASPDCSTARGVLDMSGNAVEWTWDCQGTGSLDDRCAIRGGDASSASSLTRCDSHDGLERKKFLPYLGFRCCYQP